MTKDNEIQEMYRNAMQRLAADLDVIFNGNAKGHDRKTCFVLLISPFDGPVGQRVNYISNGERKDVVTMLKEITARFEGQPEQKGTA